VNESHVRTRSTFALRLIAAVCIAAATFAILSTARTFSGTVDEPAHLDAGMQWLSTGEYTYDLPHPPLARAAIAFGPYLHGLRTTGAPNVYGEGAAILGAGQHYVDTLASARHGTIWFFLILAFVVWAWARRLTGEVGAAIAALLVATNPNLLAHAGLATTDMGCAAMTTLALFTAVWWLDDVSWWRSILVGAAIGLAVSSRLSALAFVGAPLVICYALRGVATKQWKFDASVAIGESIARVVVVGAVAILVVFAVYRFSPRPFIAGVQTFFTHGSAGHPTFLLGTASNRGWWYYFPVALLVKTPLPLMILCVLGAGEAVRRFRHERDWTAIVPVVSALAMLAVSMTVRVDLGVRLVLPMYPLMAIVGAQGAIRLLGVTTSNAKTLIAGGLCAAAVMIAIAAHPDDLAYFNLFAGEHPEHVLVDSNLDWGQDLYRLRDTLQARGIKDSVKIAYFGTADVSAAGVPRARLLGLHERPAGWIAASETYLAGEWVGPAYQWLFAYPAIARIGPSMRLWYIPDATHPAPPTTTDSLRRSGQ
jgi:hypothetical protein